jgi:N-acetylmuramoyl-L-alanine amidase
MRPVGIGDTGKQVVDIQTRLTSLGYFLGSEGADGLFGPHTENAIRAFQQRRLLFSDGVVEDNTWTELVEAGYELGERLLYMRAPHMRGDDVLYLQRRLGELGFDCGPVDGIFSPAVEVAVTEFQRNAGLNVDGIVGETTLDRLLRLHKIGPNGGEGSIADRMDGYVGRRSFPGLRVSIDPAHGGADLGVVKGGRDAGTREKDLNLALAMELAGVLKHKGVVVYLSRGTDVNVPLYERTESANAWEPDIHFCLHHSASPSQCARGAATYYFANWIYECGAGKRLAGYIVDALCRELGRVDLHKHGRNYASLREVKPLAVLIEPGFTTNPEEGRELTDPRMLAREAEAIVRGVEAYLNRL